MKVGPQHIINLKIILCAFKCTIHVCKVGGNEDILFPHKNPFASPKAMSRGIIVCILYIYIYIHIKYLILSQSSSNLVNPYLSPSVDSSCPSYSKESHSTECVHAHVCACVCFLVYTGLPTKTVELL